MVGVRDRSTGRTQGGPGSIRGRASTPCARATVALAVLLLVSAMMGAAPSPVETRTVLAATPDLVAPFGPGPAWQIIQGYSTDATHGGTFPDERYAFDL